MKVREHVPAAPAREVQPVAAPVPTAAPSTNPARELLAALRGRLDRDRGLAMRELEARAAEPEWRTAEPEPIADAAETVDADPRAQAHALAGPAPLQAPWSFPWAQPPDARWLHDAFAGRAAAVADEVAAPEPALDAQADHDELAQGASRPKLAQHRPAPHRLADKHAPPRKRPLPRPDGKIAPRPGLSKAAADKLETQRQKAEADLAAEPKVKAGAVPAKTTKQQPMLADAPKPAPAAKPQGGPAVSGGGGAADVAAWKAKHVDKAQAIPSPPAPDEQRFVLTFKDAQVKHRAKTPGEKLKLLQEAEKAVTPVDNPDRVPKFPDPDEVGDANKLVAAKANLKIPETTLPDLEPTPLGNTPQVGMFLRMGQDQQLHIIQEVKGADGKLKEQEIKVVAEDAKAPPQPGVVYVKTPKPGADVAKSLADLKKAGAAKQLDIKKSGKQGKGLRVSDDRPLAPPVVPDFAKVDVVTVVAKALAAGKRGNAIKVVEDARGAYAGGTMTTDEVSKFVGGEQEIVAAELRKVAGAAEGVQAALDKKVAEEQQKVATQTDEAKQKLADAYKSSKDVVKDDRKELDDHIVEIRAAFDRFADDQADQAKGGTDPKEIRAKQKKYKEESDGRVVWWRAEYKRMGERRAEEIQKAADKQRQAYEAAAEIDLRQIDLQLKRKPSLDRDLTDPAYAETVTWLKQMQRELRVDANKLKANAQTTAEGYRIDVGAAGVEAGKLIDQWADDRLGRKRSWWDKLVNAILDWFGFAKEKSKEWEDISIEDNSANLAKDNVWLAKFQLTHDKELTDKQIDDSAHLTEEQKAMAKVVIKGGDSATALAAGLVARISQQRRPTLTRQFQAEVLTWASYEAVERVGVGEGSNVVPGFAMEKATAVYAAGVDQVGTNEGGIFKELEGLTQIQGRAVELAYRQKYNRSLRSDLKGELYDWTQQLTGSRGDYDRSLQLLEGKTAASIAVQIHQAMKETFLGTGWGTNSEEIHRLMKGKSPAEVAAIKAEYKRLYGKELITEVDAELDDGWSTQHDVQRFQAYLRQDEKTARTIEADQAMRGSAFFGLKTDRKQLEGVYEQAAAEVEKEAAEKGWDDETTKRKIAEAYAALDKDYEVKYGADFPANKRQNGESALRTAMRESFTWGTGKGAFNFTTSTGDLDLLLSYHDVGEKKDAPDIKQVFKEHRAEVSAAKVQIEHRSIFYADDKEIQKAIAAPTEAAYKDSLRDKKLALEKEKDTEFEKLGARRQKASAIKDPIERKKQLDALAKEERELRHKWAPTGDAYAARLREIKAAAQKDAEVAAADNFDLLTKTFDTRYRDWNKQYNFGEDKGFEQVVRGDTGWGWLTDQPLSGPLSGLRTGDNDKTIALLEGKGYLSLEDKLFFAVKGGGTDEDIAKEVFADADFVEAKQIITNLGTKRLGAKPEDAYAKAKGWVLSDFSGREGQDQEIAMMGVPRTPDEHLQVAEKRLEQESRSGPGGIADAAPYLMPIGGALALFPPTAMIGVGVLGTAGLAKGMQGFDASSMELLEMRVANLRRVKAEADALAAKGFKPGDEEYDKVERKIAIISQGVQDAVQIHRAQVDAMVDVVTNVITAVITAAVIVISVLAAPFTGGGSLALGAAALIAVVGAVTATVANIAVKMALKGDAYGWEEIGYDAAVGLVEAIASGLTAGLGDKFLKVAFLAKMAQSGLISRMAAHGIANAAEGLIQALPGALAGNILNDENHRNGNVFANVMLGTVMQVGMSTAMGGTMGMLGGIKRPTQFITPGAPQYDDLFKAYKTKHPGASAEQFRVDLHNTILAGEHPGLGRKQLNEVARDQLLAHLDKDTRRFFKNVDVEVVSADEFTRLTRNAGKGEAVVMIRGGKPSVVVKAGTDLATLHREAPHLVQAIAEDTRKLVAKLDERVLAHWDKLPIETQVDLYRTKLVLEIDAHEKLIDALRGKRLASRLGAEGVAKELEYAERTLANLRSRMKAVDALDLDAVKATGKRPQYLEEPARLFSKKTDEVAFADVKPSRFSIAEFPKGAKRDDIFASITGDIHDPSTPRLRPGSALHESHILVGYTEGSNQRFKLVPRAVDGDVLPDPKPGHYWYQGADGTITHKRIQAPKGETLGEFPSFIYDTAKKDFEAVAGKATDWPTRSDKLVKDLVKNPLPKATGFDDVFTRIDALSATGPKLTDGDKLLLGRWASVLKQVEDKLSAEESAALFARLVKVFEDRPLKPGGGAVRISQAHDDQFRHILREKIGDVVGAELKKGGQPARDLLDGVLGAAQKLSNADKGHLFTDTVRGHLGAAEGKLARLKELPLTRDIPAHPHRAQDTRTFDDAFEVTKPLGKDGPTSGKLFGEMKAGEGAFKLKQALDYCLLFVEEQDGKLVSKAATVLDRKGGAHTLEGFATMFASETDATTALDRLALDATRGELFRELFVGPPRRSFIGYYDDAGKLRFLGPDRLPPSPRSGTDDPPGGSAIRKARRARAAGTAEPIAGSAAHVPGSETFRGGAGESWRPAAATRDAVKALDTIPDVEQIGNSHRFKVKLDSGDEIKLRVISRSMGDKNPIGDVANYEYSPHTRTAVVQVSDRATPEAIERAMHHEVGELRHELSGAAGATDVLGRGKKPAPGAQLSKHDAGRVAELAWLANKLDVEPGRVDLRREIHALVEELGIRESFSGAAERMDLINGKLGAREQARLAPFRRRLPALPADEAAAVRAIRDRRKLDIAEARRRRRAAQPRGSRAMIERREPGDPELRPERWRDALGKDDPSVRGMNETDPVGREPHVRRLPKAKAIDPDASRTEASSGFWEDEHAKGNTRWWSDNERVNKITGYQPIEFKDGYVVLDPYAQETVYLKQMFGDERDFVAGDRELARRHNQLKRDGTPNQSWAEDFRKQHRLTWHHHQDGTRLQLVPRDLHENLPHAGGASAARDATD